MILMSPYLTENVFEVSLSPLADLKRSRLLYELHQHIFLFRDEPETFWRDTCIRKGRKISIAL